ncbi:MAG: twin-arginine translocation signal domain-containing protein [Nitrospiraceae bacterium]|nr:MAG: twin-arginine translocation signal domain-containing protein [Nitrospiraceae bacterium]
MALELSRRHFIKTAAVAGIATAICSRRQIFADEPDAAEQSMVPLPHIPAGGLIRPPGALPEKAFLATCISCGVCVNVCHVMKYDAVATSPFGKGGLRGIFEYGAPYIKDMRDFPCGLCMECPEHCPTGALQETKKEDVAMGMALIDFGLCFGWNGDVCLSCSKACPMGGKIFEFYNGEWGNQPYINDNCVGCGLCVKYCPLGGSAIKVVTKRQYELSRTAYINDFRRLLAMSSEERYNIVYGQNLPGIMERGKLIEREYR